MCRLLGYLGSILQLDRLLYQPEHSLVVQSYQPREMTAGLLNADGFGLGWYHPTHADVEPFTYKNILPIWNDANLPTLSRYIESGCILANVRSATPGQGVDLSNCQPFRHGQVLAIHNGYIEDFHQTLYRPIRDQLDDAVYHTIRGSTDSEHIIALFTHYCQAMPDLTIDQALAKTLYTLADFSVRYAAGVSANIIISDGRQLIASRFACRGDSSDIPAPSLYWLQDDPQFPESLLVASEPLCAGNWVALPEHSILQVSHDRALHVFNL
jgi:glutamine amidotransferase